MKKWLLIFITFFFFAGCGPSQKGDAAPGEQFNSVFVEIAPISAAPADTPGAYPSNENIFVPAVEESSTPSSTPTFTSTPEPTWTPEPKERYVVEEGVYTVAWLTDTQHYAHTFPEIYPIMTGFLRDKAEEMNLVYVVHTGDLVHRNGEAEDWRVAREAMDLLVGIPTGVLAGNHDMDKSGGGYQNYYTYFGEKQYSDQDCYGKSFENNRGHYDLITIADRNYIFVYMSHAPNKKAIQFMVNAFNKYPDRVGVLCLHDFITTEGTLSEAGKQLREQVVAVCPNVYMVLCGHRYGLYTLEDAFDDDGDGVKERTVYEIMMNYQAAGKEGGSGYLRLMQFDEEKGEIRCVNYSPYLNDYDWLDDPTHKERRYEMDETSESFILKMPWL